MNILTLEDNRAFSLNNLPDQLEDDIRFCVLDNSAPATPAFSYPPLIFLESFNAPAMVMEIAGHEITMPLDWSIAIGDGNTLHDLEVLPLTSINGRDFDAWLINPIKGSRFDFGKIKITNFYNDVKWYFPKMKTGQLLAIPLDDSPTPLCAFFVKDISRQSETIEYEKLL